MSIVVVIVTLVIGIVIFAFGLLMAIDGERWGATVFGIGIVLAVLMVVCIVGFYSNGTAVTEKSSKDEITHELVQIKTAEEGPYLLQIDDEIEFCYLDDNGVRQIHRVSVYDVSVSYSENAAPSVQYTKASSTSYRQWWIIKGVAEDNLVETDYKFVVPSKESIVLTGKK